MPEYGRNVEEYRLAEQYERNPLVVRNHLSVVVAARQRRVPRQVVGVPDPAVVGRVLAVRSGEVFWRPARDRIADVLVHADEDGEDDEQNDRVTGTETIAEVVVVGTSSLGSARDQTNQTIHPSSSLLTRFRRSTPLKQRLSSALETH